MGNPAPRPKHLAAKLLAIRRSLGLSQIKMVQRLGSDLAYHRISEYESGRRMPSLMVLLAYARAAGISTDLLIDDELEIDKVE
jgi:transcriptional regulator with XRE-family HTH domain